MSTDWPFEDPPNVATMTVRDVIEGHSPVLFVVHSEDDGMWQFLTGGPVEMADARLVSLEYMWRRDPTLGELADLPVGWQAWRDDANQPWQREPADEGPE